MTNTDLEAQFLLDEIKTKHRMEQDIDSSTRSALESQLECLIKAATTSSSIAAIVMCQSTQEGFVKVRNKLDSIYNVVLKRAPKSVIVQEFVSISTEP